MISAYTGSSLPSLSLVMCTVFIGIPTTQAFPVTAGTTYYFQVRHLSSASPPNTPLTFGLAFHGPPTVANDNFADARVISALPFNDVVDNTQPTKEIGEPGICGPTNQTVWYRFTPLSTVVVQADEAGTAFPSGESELAWPAPARALTL
jgi:hypothetical protein